MSQSNRSKADSFRRRRKRQPRRCEFRLDTHGDNIPGLPIRCKLPLHGHHQRYETWQGKPAIYHTDGDYIWGEVLVLKGKNK